MAKVSRARSRLAYIMREFGTGKVFLRVQNGPRPEHYIDCSLAHADLKVLILDNDAFIYRDKDKDGKDYAVLDYSTETITGGFKPPKKSKPSKKPKKSLLSLLDVGKSKSHNKEAIMAATKRTTATKKTATKRTTATRKGPAKAGRAGKSRRS